MFPVYAPLYPLGYKMGTLDRNGLILPYTHVIDFFMEKIEEQHFLTCNFAVPEKPLRRALLYFNIFQYSAPLMLESLFNILAGLQLY